jgi:hypothetical protein
MASPGCGPDLRELHSRYDEQLRKKDERIRDLRQEIESLRSLLGKTDGTAGRPGPQPAARAARTTRQKASGTTRGMNSADLQGAGIRFDPAMTLRIGIPLALLFAFLFLLDFRRNGTVRDFHSVLAQNRTRGLQTPPAPAAALKTVKPGAGSSRTAQTAKPAPPALKELEKLIEFADYQLARRKILEMDERDRLSPEVAAIALAADLMLDPERLRSEKFDSPVAIRAVAVVIRKSPDWKSRYSAIRALEKTSDAGRLPVLLHALEQDPDWAVRAEAAAALGGEAGEKIGLALKNAAQLDPELLVRTAAKQALARPASPRTH